MRVGSVSRPPRRASCRAYQLGSSEAEHLLSLPLVKAWTPAAREQLLERGQQLQVVVHAP